MTFFIITFSKQFIFLMQIETLSNQKDYIIVFHCKGEQHAGVKIEITFTKVCTEVTLT